MNYRVITAGALAGAALLPAGASAHKAACVDGQIVTDFNQLNPVVTRGADGSATIVWGDGYTVTLPACGPTPAPTPLPPETVPLPPPPIMPPPVIVPPPITPLNCAQLRATGAGPKWLKARGCVKPPVSYRCPARLLPSKAWQTIIFNRHGVRCPFVQPPKRRTPAVAG